MVDVATFKSGSFIRSDNSKGETTYRVNANIGDWDDKGQAKKFYAWLGIEGLKIMGIEEEADNKKVTGKVFESIYLKEGKFAREKYSIQRSFNGIDDEDIAIKIYDWLQHGAMDHYKGVKQKKLSD